MGCHKGKNLITRLVYSLSDHRFKLPKVGVYAILDFGGRTENCLIYKQVYGYRQKTNIPPAKHISEEVKYTADRSTVGKQSR